jgi:hypothetical protein
MLSIVSWIHARRTPDRVPSQPGALALSGFGEKICLYVSIKMEKD